MPDETTTELNPSQREEALDLGAQLLQQFQMQFLSIEDRLRAILEAEERIEKTLDRLFTTPPPEEPTNGTSGG